MLEDCSLVFLHGHRIGLLFLGWPQAGDILFQFMCGFSPIMKLTGTRPPGSRMAAHIHFPVLLLALAGVPSRAAEIRIAGGAGIILQSASKFEPYTDMGIPHFFPHARVSLEFLEVHTVGLEYARVTSRSMGWFTRSDLLEQYSRVTVFHRLNFRPEDIGGFDSGVNVFIQPGVNRLTHADKDESAYSGSVQDRYVLLGMGISFEKTAWEFLNLGCRLGYLHEMSRDRRNDLKKSVGGEEPRLVYGTKGSRPYPIEFGIEARLQYGFPFGSE